MKYTENQRFRRTDILLLLVVLIGATLYQVIDQLVIHPSSNGSELPIAFMIILGLLTILIALNSLRLITRIDKKGIRFQFYPWHFKTRKIAWEDVVACRVIDMPMQLSLWNAPFGTPDLFYSFTGRKGLEIQLANGQQIFLGSQTPQEVAEAVQRFMPDSIA